MFPGRGSHLERYSGRFDAVEINSSFYRHHLPKTYGRWAATVPAGFRFSVKVPREITHRRRLIDAGELLRAFLSEAGALGEKLGPVLIQLPPGAEFVQERARSFFDTLRGQFSGAVVCEPRHPSWFTREANQLFVLSQVARVAADPAIVPEAGQPGGWNGITYYRLHGSPKVYYSSYSLNFLSQLAGDLSEGTAHGETWSIFDNTAESAALENALELRRLLGERH